jgi:hypothetical protein
MASRSLKLTLALEAKLLEQLELERQLKVLQTVPTHGGVLSPLNLEHSWHPSPNSRKKAMLKSSKSMPAIPRPRKSIDLDAIDLSNSQKVRMALYEHDTLGGGTLFDKTFRPSRTPVTPNNRSIPSSPKATFGRSSREGGSQRALLIDLTTKAEISTIYRALDVGMHPTLEGPTMLPGSIGHQVEGRPHRQNSPKVIFSTATKEGDRKKYLSKELAAIESSDRDDLPGAGAYENNHTAIGPQTLSTRRNEPAVSFSKAAPTGRDPVYCGDHRPPPINPQAFGAKPYNKHGIFVEPQILKAPKSVVDQGYGTTFSKSPRITEQTEQPVLLSKGWLEVKRGKDAPAPKYNVREQFSLVRSGTGVPLKKKKRRRKKRFNHTPAQTNTVHARLDDQWMKHGSFGAKDGGHRDSYLESDTRRRCQNKKSLAEQIEDGRRAINEKYKALENNLLLNKQKHHADFTKGVSAIGRQPNARRKKLGRTAPNFSFSNVPRQHYSESLFYTPESNIQNRKEKHPYKPTH